VDQDKPAVEPRSPPAAPSGAAGARPWAALFPGAGSIPLAGPFPGAAASKGAGSGPDSEPGIGKGSLAPDSAVDSLPAPIPAPLLSLRILALLCIGLPLLVYAVVGATRYQQIRAETEVRLDRALRIAVEHALRVLDTNETVLARALDVLGSDDEPRIRRREAQIHAQLREMSQNKPQIQSLRVVGGDGRALANDRAFPVPDELEGANRRSFQWHRDRTDGLYVSGPIPGGLAGPTFFDISRGRHLPDGRFAGIVSISLLPAHFESFHGDLGADEPGLAITLLRDDGVILSRWPPLPNAPDRLSPDSPVMTRIRGGDTGGSAHGVSSVDGRERLLTFAKVGNYPLFLGTGMDVGEIRRRWLQEMAWLAAFGLPPLLGLFMVARVALRRTREVLEAAQRLSEETRARRRVEESLLQSQKLEALGRLTGGVAHDFNNALMVISNNLYLLRQKHPEVDRARVDSMDRAVHSATKLTRQLLAFSRRQALVPEYVRLQDRLPPFEDLLEPVLGSQIELKVTTSPDTSPILVDAAEFELSLINLAVNARDAMPNGGSFRISARNAAEKDLPPKLKGPMVMVEAVDSGCGIEPQIIHKVFDPFFTTKPVGGGTGLGLSQIYGLCRRAGGLATIQSRVGVGTAVRLFFPAVAERPAEIEDNPVTLPRHLARNVLLVEDDDEVAGALQLVLQSLGCTVIRMDRAAAAEEWLSRQASLPDVLLTDVVMPGEMDGVALAQAVRRKFPQLHLILMTGYAEQMDAISRQGFEIIPKPCSAEMLAAAIGRGGAAKGPA
jgi:signal transduction histidine kinase/ActR/RegA family two-component response regulator